MADTAAQSEVVGLMIDQLPEALEVLLEDLLVLQQNGVAKKLSGGVLVAQLAAALDGHGGIQSIEKAETNGLVDTFTATFADGTTASFTVTNGRSINTVQYAGIVEDALSIQITYNDGTTEVMPVILPKKYEDTPFDIIDLPRNQTQDRYVKNADGSITVLDQLPLFSAIVPCPKYLGWKLSENAAIYLYIFKKVNGEYIIDPDYEFATYGSKNYFNYLSYKQKEYEDGGGAYNRFIEVEDRYFCYRISSEGEGVTLLGADEWPESMTENIAVVPDSVSPKGTHIKKGENYSVVLPEGCTYAVRIQDSSEYSHRDFNVSVVSEVGTTRISNGASFGVIPSGEGAALLTIPVACPLKNVSIYTSKFVEVSSVGGRRQKARDIAEKLIKDFNFTSQKSILWNDTKTLPLLEGKRFYGVPYSSRWVNSHFVGFEVSVETALNALNDPYSIAYDGGLMPGGEKWVVSGKSEITVDPKDPTVGRGPGYGLVCSAFTGLIFGNPYPQSNRGITFDSNYAIAPMTALVSGTIVTNKAMTHCVMVDELYREGYSILEATDPCVAKTVHTNTVPVSGTLNGKTQVSFLDNYMYTVTNLDDSGYDNPLLKFPAHLPQGVVRPWRGHKAVYGPWDKSDKGSGIGVTIHPTEEQVTAGTLQVVVVYEPGTANEETVLNETVLASAQYLNIAFAVTKPGTYSVSCGDGNPELFRYYTHDEAALSFDKEGRAVFNSDKVNYVYARVTGYGGDFSGLMDTTGDSPNGEPIVIAAGQLYPDLAANVTRIKKLYAAIVTDPDPDDCWGRYSVPCNQTVVSEFFDSGSFDPDCGEPGGNVDLTGYATEDWVGKNYQPKGEYLIAVPAGYATEEYVRNKIAEAELGGEDVDLSGYAQKSELPTKVSQLENDAGYAKGTDIPTKPSDIGAQPEGDYALKAEIPAVPVKSVNGQTGDVKLRATDVSARPDDWMPTASDVGALPASYVPPNQTATQVGADPSGTAANAVSAHNQSKEAHPDILESVRQLSENKADKTDLKMTMFISPTGSDSNDGLTADKPKKTVKACVNSGATRISAKRGVYKEVVSLSNIGELEIFPTDNDLTYAVGTEREPIVFDTSDSIAVSSLAAYNSIKRVAYSNSSNTQFDKVFTKKSQTPIYGDGNGSRYNATVWLLSNDEKTVCIKLKPVLTVAECEAQANTFTYVSGYIYINANMSSVAKIVVPTNWDCGIYVNGAERFVLKEVEVRFAGSYNIDIRNCAYFDFYKCACKYTSYGSGFHPFNSNGKMTACYATKNYDGYGISGYGHTTYVDCVSEFNFDDGMSHHNATSGTVIGGRYEGNGKGGNTPAYGAKVNIYGGLYKDNASFGIGYLWASDLDPASGMVQGAVMVGNPVGLTVNANCDVVAMNCTYQGNTAEKDARGNLTEYNANYVKTINGVKPDANGNIKVEGMEVLPAYTNRLPLAIDTDRSVYNGTGYKNGYRLNSSATVKEAPGNGHTGFIKVVNGETVRMKNYTQGTEGYDYIHYFDGAFTRVNSTQPSDHFAPDANGIYTIVIDSTCEYIRISAGEFSEETIITVNEEITE